MSEPAGKTVLKPVYGWLPLVYFIIQVVAGVWLAFWLLYNHQPQTGDDIEHLHSAWLVHEGKVPYIDFFQHHNPLLWYLFSPLAGYFAYDLVLFDVVRIISTVVMFASLYVAALIVKRFMSGNWYAGLLCIASVFPSYVIFSGQDFRPDNYMVLMFMLGLYCFFAYLERRQLRDLVLSFMAMFTAFLFMQKVIFLLAFFAAVGFLSAVCRQNFCSGFFKSADSSVYRRDIVSGTAPCARYGRALLALPITFLTCIFPMFTVDWSRKPNRNFMLSVPWLCAVAFTHCIGETYTRG